MDHQLIGNIGAIMQVFISFLFIKHSTYLSKWVLYSRLITAALREREKKTAHRAQTTAHTNAIQQQQRKCNLIKHIWCIWSHFLCRLCLVSYNLQIKLLLFWNLSFFLSRSLPFISVKDFECKGITLLNLLCMHYAWF